MAVSFTPIRSLLQTGTNTSSRWFSYLGLGIGVLLLLCSIQMFINIQQLLGGESPRKEGYDFISISKTITNETMGQREKNLFNENDIKEIAAQPFIQGVSPLVATRFRVELSAGDIIPFSTNMFLESLDNNFIDTVPPNFNWQEGQDYIPIVFSSDFLEIYNVFAPGYGLPQLSEATASQVMVYITCYGENHVQQTFRGSIVALSDRVNSIIVPKNFIDWANKKFGSTSDVKASRLYIKTKDANNPDFLSYLQQKNYKVNKDKTKFGRVKQVLQGIFSGLGIFGLLVVILALMLFSFYLQLMIARSKDNLQLLLMLGYSPNWLSKNVSKQFIPVYILVVVIALGLTEGMQWAFHHFAMFNRPELSSWLHWSVLATSLLLIGLSLITNYRMVKKLLYKLV
ncbi:FtsX-like permease family protein [Niastella caeni]|uniref:FtsX-like permease family protein n=1 Tax=Niastella caeni TaxID=2569763 RepID=A0A4S8I337_9BACT|nr:FtsX-like permease family protein [Niastella caeni]THU41264.1 FtsX-like permease family protein [Niastella caeni]